MNILIDGQTLLTPEIHRGIGAYFRHVVENLLHYDFVNDFYVNAPRSSLDHLSPWTRAKLHVIEEKFAGHGNDSNRGQLYSHFIGNLIEKEKIDLYWSPNPLMPNVFLPARDAQHCRFAATIFDLIPAVMKEQYIAHWPGAVFREYEQRLALLESDYNILLHISKHTEADCRRLLRVEDKTHLVTPLGVDESFHPYPFPDFTNARHYVLYPGGFDPRKNMTRALEAFAEMKKLYRKDDEISALVFVIVCDIDEESRRSIMSQADSLQVADKIELTGFVSDQQMVALYQKARCVFFPSLYEGFGLPVLEALACGVPVAASNTSAIPEVAGDFATYFDPVNVEDMANALERAVKQPRDWESRQRRHQHAAQFSWRRTAQLTIGAFAGAVSSSDFHQFRSSTCA